MVRPQPQIQHDVISTRALVGADEVLRCTFARVEQGGCVVSERVAGRRRGAGGGEEGAAAAQEELGEGGGGRAALMEGGGGGCRRGGQRCV
jgi:hypothetical protein